MNIWKLQLGAMLLAILAVTRADGSIELPNVGDSVSNTLVYSNGESGGVVAHGNWANETTSMTGTVVRQQNSFQYSYVMTVTDRSIGHVVIETMPMGQNLPFGLLSGDLFNATLTAGVGETPAASWTTNIGAHLMGNGNNPLNPGLPSNVYGIRIEDPRNASGELLESTTWTLTFESLRAPEWGDMYSRGDSESFAHNTGFEFDDSDIIGLYHLPTPGNSFFAYSVPEASSVITWCLLALLGIGTSTRIRGVYPR